MTSVIIKGKIFDVFKICSHYLLKGSRGAEYTALRQGTCPSTLLLINMTNQQNSLGSVRLTDKRGFLEIIQE